MKIKIIDMSVYLIFCSFVFGCGSGDKAQVAKPNEAAKAERNVKPDARQQSESLKLAKEADDLFDKGMAFRNEKKGAESRKMFYSAHEKYLDITPLLIPNQTGDKEALFKAKQVIKSEGTISTNDVTPSSESKPSQAVSGNSYKTPKPSNSKNSAEQAIQNMKNAGTYTPEAERNIKELYNNQKKLGLVK